MACINRGMMSWFGRQNRRQHPLRNRDSNQSKQANETAGYTEAPGSRLKASIHRGNFPAVPLHMRPVRARLTRRAATARHTF